MRLGAIPSLGDQMPLPSVLDVWRIKMALSSAGTPLMECVFPRTVARGNHGARLPKRGRRAAMRNSERSQIDPSVISCICAGFEASLPNEPALSKMATGAGAL